MLSKYSVNSGLVLVGMMLLTLPFSSAHLASGQDKEINGYSVDMGIDPEFINAGEPFTLALSISNASTEEQLSPRKVWVRILKDEDGDEGVVFAATFAPEAGNVMTVMSLPEGGAYTIDARFFGDGPKAWAVAEFPLTIQPRKASGMVMVWVLAALGVAILSIIWWMWFKAKTTPSSMPRKNKTRTFK